MALARSPVRHASQDDSTAHWNDLITTLLIEGE
jgi:hypothetical protein